MKCIFPDKDSKTIVSCTVNPITQQQYEDLVCRTNTAVCCAEAAITCATNVEQDVFNGTITPKRVVSVEHISSESESTCYATIRELSVLDCLKVTDANVGYIDVTGCLNSHCIVGRSVRANSLCSSTGEIDDLSTTNINSDSVLTGSLNVTSNAEVQGNFQVDGDFSANNTCFSNATVNCLTGQCTCMQNGCFTESVCTKNLNARHADLTCGLTTSTIDSNYNLHLNDPQHIIGGTIRDHFILLPIFTNGSYYLEARNDDDTKLWSVEIFNSIDNIRFSWSQSRLNMIEDLSWVTDASGAVKVQLHITADEEITLYRQSQSTANTLPPAIYTVNQLPQADGEFVVTTNNGNYVKEILYADNFHVESVDMDKLTTSCLGISKELQLRCDPSTSDLYKGEANQYVANKELAPNIIVPTWNTPANSVSCVNENLITSKAVATYTGETDEAEYPIVNLGDESCVHGSLKVGEDLTVTCTFASSHIGDGTNPTRLGDGDSLIIRGAGTERLNKTVFQAGIRWYDENVVRVDEPDESWTETSSNDIGTIKALHDNAYVQSGSWYKVTGFGLVIYYESTPVSDQSIINELEDTSRPWIHVYRREYYKDVKAGARLYRQRNWLYSELAAWTTLAMSQCPNRPVVFNGTDCTIETTNNLTVECANVDSINACSITTAGNVDVGGDLYVRGTTHTVEEETLSTGSDTIVLRQNNPVSLANGELAGIIVNKYNGTCNLAIGTGCDGQLRIGHPTGTTSSYVTIYFKDDVWYDTDKTTVITPQGELTSYDSKSIEDGFTKYTNAVFTLFDYTALQPVLTREEESNICNNALLKFNTTTHRAEDIPLPTTSEQSLTACVNNGAVSYVWTDKQPGIYCFATMAAYNAYTGNIPIGSTVLIEECNSYVSNEVME